MGASLGRKYIPYTCMDPLGQSVGSSYSGLGGLTLCMGVGALASQSPSCSIRVNVVRLRRIEGYSVCGVGLPC